MLLTPQLQAREGSRAWCPWLANCLECNNRCGCFDAQTNELGFNPQHALYITPSHAACSCLPSAGRLRLSRYGLALFNPRFSIHRSWVRTQTGTRRSHASTFGMRGIAGPGPVPEPTRQDINRHRSATRDPLKEACLARGVWVNS